MGSRKSEAEATSWLGVVKFSRGEHEEAERLGLQARDWLDRTRDSYFQVQNLVRPGRLRARARRRGAGERGCGRRVPIALEIGGWVVVETYRFLVEALLRQGRLEDARELVEFADRNLPEEDAYARAATLLAEGAVGCGGGKRDGRARRLCPALDLLQELNMTVELAQARLAYARALRSVGAVREAAVQLARGPGRRARLQRRRAGRPGRARARGAARGGRRRRPPRTRVVVG